MRVALIGFGGISATVAATLHEVGNSNDIEIVGVFVRPERTDAARKADTLDLNFVSTLDDLFALRPDIVAECAGHSAVREFGERILSAGIDLVVISAGALADDKLRSTLITAARTARATIFVPAGALAGIDGLTAARYAGLSSVTYTGRKPPAAWVGTPAEKLVDLRTLAGSKTVFSGNAREAALKFPKNSNVAAIVALAGMGFDDTDVTLVADAGITENQHLIEVCAGSGNFQVSLAGRTLPDNPKTSALAAYSTVKCLVDRRSALIL